MKKKLVLKGILAAVLVFGIVFAGCKGKGEQNKADGEQSKIEEEKIKQNTITITDFPGSMIFSSAEVNVLFLLDLGFLVEEKSYEAVGKGYVSEDGSVTIPLFTEGGMPWSRNESYIIMLNTSTYYGDGVTGENTSIYTDGKTFRELGIRTRDKYSDINPKLPKFKFESENATISLDKFFDVHEYDF